MKNLASPWLRVLASLIDVALGWVIFWWLVLMIAQATSVPAFLDGLLGLVVWGFLLIPILMVWLNFFLISRFGGTLGKILTGVAIVNPEGNYISFWRAFFRNTVGYVVSGIVFWLGFIWIFVDREHRGWHDMVADTYVVVQNKTGALIGFLALILLLFSNYFLLRGVVLNVKANADAGVYTPIGQVIEDWSKSLKTQDNGLIDQAPMVPTTPSAETKKNILPVAPLPKTSAPVPVKTY